jgi:hypothetical protein
MQQTQRPTPPELVWLCHQPPSLQPFTFRLTPCPSSSDLQLRPCYCSPLLPRGKSVAISTSFQQHPQNSSRACCQDLKPSLRSAATLGQQGSQPSKPPLAQHQHHLQRAVMRARARAVEALRRRLLPVLVIRRPSPDVLRPPLLVQSGVGCVESSPHEQHRSRNCRLQRVPMLRPLSVPLPLALEGQCATEALQFASLAPATCGLTLVLAVGGYARSVSDLPGFHARLSWSHAKACLPS